MHARQGFEWIHPVHEVLRYTGGGEAQRALCQGMRLEHHPDAQKSRAQYLPLLELAVQEAPQDDLQPALSGTGVPVPSAVE